MSPVSIAVSLVTMVSAGLVLPGRSGGRARGAGAVGGRGGG